MMLCPYCLYEVESFTESRTELGRVRSCPRAECAQPVPLRYAEDCLRYPPVIFSLIGYRGHGKTVYLSSLFEQFERVGSGWSEFAYAAVDEAGLRELRKKQHELRQGQLPASTPVTFREPTILRLERSPALARCHLLAYDGGGEAFEEVGKFKVNRHYLSRSPAVVWLISLADLEAGNQALADLLIRYTQAVTELGGDPKYQQLLIVLTKSDLLTARPDIPRSMREFLDGEGPDEHQVPDSAFTELSHDIEVWLDAMPECRNFVRLARREFGAVRYCALSALGAAPRGDRLDVHAHPRGVLVPLYWLQSFLLPRIRVESDGRVCGTYWDLAEAVKAAPAGALLRLNAGTFYLDRPLEVRQTLRLSGSGSDAGGTRIVSDAEDAVVMSTSDGAFAAEAIAFVHRGATPAHVAWIARGGVDLRSCRFSGAVAHRGANDRGGCGLVLGGQVQGTVADCVFEANEMAGIYALEHAQPLLRDNECRGGRWGIVFRGFAAGSALRNTCRETSQCAILVDDDAAPGLEGNTCADNRGDGLLIGPQARPSLGTNQFQRNQRDVNDQRSSLIWDAMSYLSSLWRTQGETATKERTS